jgi:hypothetical protein
VNLLRVAGEPSLDLSVRQVASISFKQVAKRYWEPEKGEPLLLRVGKDSSTPSSMLSFLAWPDSRSWHGQVADGMQWQLQGTAG